LPALRLLLLDPAVEVRCAAADALRAIDPKAPRVVNEIAELLAEREYPARVTALRILGGLGAAARPALPRVRECLADRSPEVVIESALALWRISGDKREPLALLRATARTAHTASPTPVNFSYLPILVTDFSRYPSGTPRVRAAEAIYEIEKSGEALELLVRLMEDKDPDTASAAASVLAELGEEAKQALPAVLALLKHRSPEVRHMARQLLPSIAPTKENISPR
jgi:HEAT repeat protein